MPAAGFDSWESYFYPETYNADTGVGTLRNKLDQHDWLFLRDAEYSVTAIRARQISTGEIPIERTYDAAHVQALHRALLGDVYEWAGEYRTQNMTKVAVLGGFADVKTGEVDRYLADMHQVIASTDWQSLDRDRFVETSLHAFALLNQAHPFREGNGRTAKLFMEQVAEQSPYTFDFGAVSPRTWNQASMLSGPDLGSYAVHPKELHAVFAACTVDRPREEPAAEPVDRTRQRETVVDVDRSTAATSTDRARTPATDSRAPLTDQLRAAGYLSGSSTHSAGRSDAGRSYERPTPTVDRTRDEQDRDR